MTAAQGWRDIRFTSRDGLKLYARHYPSPGSRRRPVLCLAGLTRNSRDFHDLAVFLSDPAREPRDVYTIDTRGRGVSEYANDWRQYSVPIEMQDVIDLMIVAGLHGAALIGTSRGGLITMLLAAAQPTLIGAVVLNDIGPVIERAGLERIAGYVGKVPPPADWAEAARRVRDLNQRDFPEVSDERWQQIARQQFNEAGGRPAPGYDPQIARCIVIPEGPLPALWPQFEALKQVPVMVVRGANSDLLSSDTVAEMQRRHPSLTTVTVPAEGHAPLLQDAPTQSAIARFLTATDGIGVAS